MKHPELLIPASSLEVLKTAVMFGADAVYIGGEAFGLRAKAKNFSMEEIREGIAFAHAHDVKVYITANILAHNGDLSGVRAYFEELKEIRPDALIISDPGVFMIAREVCPEIDIHISTQANNTNYGTYQFPEKLIPLFINNIRHNKPLPVYGTGETVRDWLFVEDHARAIDLIFHKGKVGDTYNIGGFNEWKNIDLIKVMIKVTDRLLGRPEGTSEKLITYVTDRAGHDLRYAIDSTKLHEELGWEPSLQFEEGIEKTVKWYLENQDWLDNVTSGEYMKYYESMYNL